MIGNSAIPNRAGCLLLTLMISGVLIIMPLLSKAESLTSEINLITSDKPDAEDTFMVEVLKHAYDETAEPLKVLIYHTHTFEAYSPDPNEPYLETERWRTKDNNHNVVAVGDALTQCLRSLGIDVTHDKTSFEPPSIDQAYERSCAMLEKRMNAGESFDLLIDLHRDALSAQTSIKRTVRIGSEDVARFMVLIGKGTTGGYKEKPDWESNLLVAQAITDRLNSQYAGLARNVKIKTGRFNQHISTRCILIECGINTNTLEEVLRGIPYLAEAIEYVLKNMKDSTTAQIGGAVF